VFYVNNEVMFAVKVLLKETCITRVLCRTWF